MLRFFAILLIILLPITKYAEKSKPINLISAELAHEMMVSGGSDQLRINIRLTRQFNIAPYEQHCQKMNREQKREYIVNELKSFSYQSQQSLMMELNSLVHTGDVSRVQSFWITNLVNCDATPAAIEQLALRNDIEWIDIDMSRILIDPVEITELVDDHLEEIAYNVSIMNVPQVWDLGFKGEGVVIAVLDTGVNYDHVDIKNNMWTHPDFPFHGWNFVTGNNNPMDINGHGTHCAGTVAGDGTAGTKTGVAPNAKIMALRVLGQRGGATKSQVWSGIQFALEHGAHVLSLSLGWYRLPDPLRATWRNVMDNVLSSGVIAVVAAGNFGGNTSHYNVGTPGDIPSPWRHPDQADTGGRSAVLTVGATDINDSLAVFSSWGPATWQNANPYNDYPLDPGQGLILPDVVAPGVNVKSLKHNSSNSYTLMSGTSMATPGVAGVIALMLSKNPNLNPEQISQILEESTYPLASQKNNKTGSGRVDALQAILNTDFPGPSYLGHTINDAEGNNDGHVNPDEFINLNIKLFNASDTFYENIEALIYSASPFINMEDSLVFFGNFFPKDTIEVHNAVSFTTASNIPGGYKIDFIIEATNGDEVIASAFYLTAHAPRLDFGNLIIDDSMGNQNGQFDPGEDVQISFTITNNGQLDALNPIVGLVANSPYLTLHNVSFELESLPPLAFQTIHATAKVSDLVPDGQIVTITANVLYGNHSNSNIFTQKIGSILEDFETGDFSAYNWTFSGHKPWQITMEKPYDGLFSARSGNIGNSQHSRMTLQYEVGIDDSISFYRSVSSQPDADFLRFYINGLTIAEWSGIVDWGKVSFPVSAGMHTFTWEYRKNHLLAFYDDAAWVDNISLPLPAVTVGWAGLDVQICETQDIQLNAFANHYHSVEWNTSGDGFFTDPFSLNPVYLPGQIDIQNNEVVLFLTIFGSEITIVDTLILKIHNKPEIFTGENTSLCVGDVFQINSAQGKNYDILKWETSGTGVFHADNILNPVYFPSANDYDTGEVSLTAKAYGFEGCDTAQHSFSLLFNASPEAPNRPAGHHIIDLLQVQQTVYEITEVETAQSYAWQLIPAHAGELIVDGTCVTIYWNVDYRGTVELTASSLNECGMSEASLALQIELFNSLGLDENTQLKVHIHPNPSEGIFTIRLTSLYKDEIVINIRNNLGELLYSESLLPENIVTSKTLNISYLSNDSYILTIETKNGRISNRILINK